MLGSATAARTRCRSRFSRVRPVAAGPVWMDGVGLAVKLSFSPRGDRRVGAALVDVDGRFRAGPDGVEREIGPIAPADACMHE